MTATTDDACQLMGPLEATAYKSSWRAAHTYRRQLAGTADAGGTSAIEGATAGPLGSAGTHRAHGFAALRQTAANARGIIGDDVVPVVPDGMPPAPGRIAARLLLARLFDLNPSVMQRFANGTPVVVVDVPDAGLHDRIEHLWKETLELDAARFIDINRITDKTKRRDYDAVCAVFDQPVPPKERKAIDMHAFAAVQLALPVLAITPSAETHLSKVLLDATTDRLTLPPFDATLIAKVIRIVTGRRCSVSLTEPEVARIGLHELLLAVRFDRSPAQCLEMLKQIAAKRIATAGSRDLTLDQLHGLDDAVAWAKSTKLDLDAWKRGEIGWDALDAGIVLDGPPGTGKTLFAKLASEHFQIPMVSATLAKWQGSGEGHLGHLLRAMKKDFDEARAMAPCILFIDEIDSFPNRSTVSHAHRDYVVEVVNAFIEQVDGVQGRHGLIFMASSNDVRRCDPAIVRSGRFNRVINVSLPAPTDIEKMLRVRLHDDLRGQPIEDLALLAFGSSGADVERIVKDARRIARQEQRAMKVADLRKAVLGGADELTPAMLERAAVHEAGHIVVTVIHHGPDDVHAVVAGGRRSAGFVLSKRRHDEAGTLADYRKALQMLLAGRAAEELELGAAGDGSGGDAQSSDLALATRIAAALAGSFGHIGPHPLLFLAGRAETEAIMDQAYMRRAVHEELLAAHEETQRILAANGTALKAVAAILIERGRIDGFEVAAILTSSSKMPHRVAG